MTQREIPEPGQFAFDGLSRAIHEKARLGILTSLAAQPEGLAFSDLRDVCSLTDGNLNRHLKVLVDEGLVELRKSPRPGRPQTRCRMTPQGRKRFLDYLRTLEQIVADASAAARSEAPPRLGAGLVAGITLRTSHDLRHGH